MSRPDISVIITTHNRAEILPRAIESVIAQTYDNFDVHIVDDCSSDNTPEVIKSIITGKENYYYWRHDDKRGLASARNTGISRSSGRYIAFLDDDDEWKSDSLAKRYEGFSKLSDAEQDCVGVVYCGCEIHIVDEDRVTYNMPKIEGNIREQLLCRNLSTIPSSCLFSRKALKDVGGFDEQLCSSIDHDIWMNFAIHEYHARAVMEPLVVTYYIKNRTTMVNDVDPRVLGVEQYLNKWGPTFKDWFGERKGLGHVRRYRARVLGGLAGTKLGQANFRQAGQLICHVFRKNGVISPDLIIIVKTITLSALRECMPIGLKSILRNIRRSIRKTCRGNQKPLDIENS